MGAVTAVILGLATGPAARALTPPLVLSRQQALELGLGASLSLRSQVLKVEENQALVGLARTRFLPKL
ncbi:MAG: hypothetical protein VKK63_06960, partial [Synechococcus sp.]|nr:hypothetical protein [Synechococcus sp.]